MAIGKKIERNNTSMKWAKTLATASSSIPITITIVVVATLMTAPSFVFGFRLAHQHLSQHAKAWTSTRRRLNAVGFLVPRCDDTTWGRRRHVTISRMTLFSSSTPTSPGKPKNSIGNANNDSYDSDDSNAISSSDRRKRRVDSNSSSDDFTPPWNDPTLFEKAKGKNAFRSRQHVNPLSRRFQMPTLLTPDWPRDMFDDLSKPLFLDIGCSRGGFLIDAANKSVQGGGGDDDNKLANYNFLGLEIRPIVAYHAQERSKKHNLQGILGFVGCNANVDLERLLTLAGAKGNLHIVTIQFPDPHFKSYKAKRRVVTPGLVTTLARFMPPGATVFLQSDVQSVLDDMRVLIRNQSQYFLDSVEDDFEYGVDNIFGIPTERETSVLDKGLPVYRALFTRTEATVASPEAESQIGE